MITNLNTTMAQSALKSIIAQSEKSIDEKIAIDAMEKGVEFALQLDGEHDTRPGEVKGEDWRRRMEKESHSSGWEIPGWIVSIIHGLAMALIRKYIG